jgi:tetratricopeptide (TPR) repeat protein
LLSAVRVGTTGFQSPFSQSLPTAGTHQYGALAEDDRVRFSNEWALYLKNLGRLPAAACCYERVSEWLVRQKSWSNASGCNLNLCNVWLLSGRLNLGESTAADAVQLATRAQNARTRSDALAYLGDALALRGEVTAASAAFRDALDWQYKGESPSAVRPLWSGRGIWHTYLLACLARHEEAIRLTKANLGICLEEAGIGNIFEPHCQLILSALHVETGDLSSAERLCSSARDWALARDAKEVLCWSFLVEAQHALADHARVPLAPPVPNVKGQTDTEDTGGASGTQDHLSAARTAVESGLKIARDCGYGLYHIDLLLVRARLYLLRGDARAALDDIEVALDTGIPANEETGQPELLAANHEACGYAWAIPAALQLRAEALLLQAAHIIGETTYKTRSRKTAPEARELIKLAKSELRKAMTRWKKLHDPEPERDDQNFKIDGKEYNYKAAETHRILSDLNGGILTCYPLEPVALTEPGAQAERNETPTDFQDISDASDEESRMPNFDVFLSHNSKDKPNVRKLKKKLVDDYKLSCWLDEDELPPGVPWQPLLEQGIRDSKSVAVLVGNDGEGPWQAEETMAALELAVREQLPVIPVLLPNAPTRPDLPMFLGNRTWVDIRGGLKKDDVDKLVWGITGTKPNP